MTGAIALMIGVGGIDMGSVARPAVCALGAADEARPSCLLEVTMTTTTAHVLRTSSVTGFVSCSVPCGMATSLDVTRRMTSEGLPAGTVAKGIL